MDTWPIDSPNKVAWLAGSTLQGSHRARRPTLRGDTDLALHEEETGRASRQALEEVAGGRSGWTRSKTSPLKNWTWAATAYLALPRHHPKTLT